MSNVPGEPLKSWQALAEEYLHLLSFKKKDDEEIRQKLGVYDPADPAFPKVLIGKLHAAQRNALCLSGGGVRSAIFSLGVIQEMARYSWKEPTDADPVPSHKLLADFDFLSTVSGGGYTGGWFSSWAARNGLSTAKVIEELARVPVKASDPEPAPMVFLRRYASFLNPKLGFTSADTWTLGTTMLRNILLNWTVLLPLLAASLVLPRIFDKLVSLSPDPCPIVFVFLAIAFVTAALATGYMIDDLPSAGNGQGSQRRFLLLCLTPLVISAALTILCWDWQAQATGPVAAWVPILYTESMLAAAAAGAIVSAVRRHRPVNFGWMAMGFGAILLSGLTGGFVSQRTGLLFGIDADPAQWDHRLFAWLAFPALIAIYGVFQLVLIAATSKLTEDEDREWWARAAGWFTAVLAGWIAAAGVVLYSDTILGYSRQGLLTLSGATTLTGAMLSFLGFSSKTKTNANDTGDSAGKSSFSLTGKMREIAIKLIMPVFLLLLLITLASINAKLSTAVWEHIGMRFHLWLGQGVRNEVALMALLAVPGFLMAWWVNANKFSLHAMYRLRLIRTFLGASNPDREEQKNPFTGFDPNDDVPMQDLRGVKPMHIVNIALNLVGGEELAWQQRKAESFTISPLHSGSWNVGYAPSAAYATGSKRRSKQDEPGIMLGAAMTISGAAANPNMGYHSSPLLTMIMTLFNARLGAWLANPGKAGQSVWYKKGPTYAVRPFIDEAFGLTTDTNAWVNLSDGGHFDNLGLYEMVLRRCHNIVVVDGSADPEYTFEDLGSAVRKIRVDLGIPIEFREHGFPIAKDVLPNSRHCALGEIQYSCVDPGAPDGRLVYIKTSLNKNEPPDVTNYARLNATFPQQPTYDLWFDEAQLESYRSLGSHIIHEICGKSGPDRKLYTVDQFVDQVKDEYLKHPDLAPPLQR